MPEFVVFLPCRIALLEDADKKLWVMTLDWDVQLDGFAQGNSNLSAELKETMPNASVKESGTSWKAQPQGTFRDDENDKHQTRDGLCAGFSAHANHVPASAHRIVGFAEVRSIHAYALRSTRRKSGNARKCRWDTPVSQ